jgi:hypothetical protein
MSFERMTFLATFALYSTSPGEIGEREGIDGGLLEWGMLPPGGRR